MKPEDIKVGDEHFVLARVGYKNSNGKYGITIQWGDGVLFTRTLTPVEVCDMFSIYENAAPKYDPYRKFRKGDRVSPQFCNGRKPLAYNGFINLMPEDGVYEVICDEDKDGIVRISYKTKDVSILACFLELVTSVEERSPYYVGTWENMLAVYKKTQTEDIIISMFSQSHPHAKEAAEAECKRLNEEYRKEQKNG